MDVSRVIGNYDVAGTEKFISHALDKTEKKTLCGLVVRKLKGDWQDTDDTHFGCLKCQRKFEILHRWAKP